MSEFKEFQSKNLDQAIQDACAFFGTEREKLEIEIIEDAKMGVFGIIGARKAKIRARLLSLPEFAMPQEDSTPAKSLLHASVLIFSAPFSSKWEWMERQNMN